MINGGGDSSPKPKKCKKGGFCFFTSYTTHTRRVDSPVIMWIQIRAIAGGGGGVRWHAPPIFFYKSGAICVFQNTLLSTKK